MKKFLLAASIMLAVAVPSAQAVTPIGCKKTFTVKMVKRAIVKTYWGTSTVTKHELTTLRRYVRCMRNPTAHHYIHWFWNHEVKQWQLRRNPPFNGPAIASWFDDSGATGCGFHAANGIATLIVPCGAHLLLKHGSHVVDVVREDSGPYVAGRLFDLPPRVRDALGCGDLCSVYYR